MGTFTPAEQEAATAGLLAAAEEFEQSQERGWGEVSGFRRWRRQVRDRWAERKAEREDCAGRLVAYGPPGPHAGVVYGRVTTRPVVETTAQLRGTYPFVCDSGPTLLGQYIGRDVYSRAAWGWDLIEAYRAGVITCPAMGVSGVIGAAKSALLKSMVIRGVPFGRRFAVPGDIRGEYVTLGRMLGAQVMVFGPGSPMRFNALAVPPRPPEVSERVWQEVVSQHRTKVLESLGEACMLRSLNPVEQRGLDLALESSVRRGSPSRWAQPTLGHIADWLQNPNLADIAADGHPNPQRIADDLYHLGVAFRRLVRGVFASVLDVDVPDPIQLSGTGVVVDLSRLQLDDAALALLVTCTQSGIELACQFDEHPWLVLYDEVWRYMQFLGLLRRLAHRVKVVREMTGGMPIFAYHRDSDWTTGNREIDAVAGGILKDIDCHVIYRQTTAELPATIVRHQLPDAVAQILPSLEQGSALWRIRGKLRFVEHEVVENGPEWQLIDTDQPIVDDYRRIKDALAKMQTLMTEAA